MCEHRRVCHDMRTGSAVLSVGSSPCYTAPFSLFPRSYLCFVSDYADSSLIGGPTPEKEELSPIT